MLEVTFSGYENYPDEIRVSSPSGFGLPSCKINGDRPTKIVVTGECVRYKLTEEERNRLSDWFFNKCIGGMHLTNREVIIDADLPEELAQWYIAAEYYKGSGK